MHLHCRYLSSVQGYVCSCDWWVPIGVLLGGDEGHLELADSRVSGLQAADCCLKSDGIIKLWGSSFFQNGVCHIDVDISVRIIGNEVFFEEGATENYAMKVIFKDILACFHYCLDRSSQYGIVSNKFLFKEGSCRQEYSQSRTKPLSRRR